MTKGLCSFVLPKHNNESYISIGEGHCFGVVDIIGSIYKEEGIEMDTWYSRKELMKR